MSLKPVIAFVAPRAQLEQRLGRLHANLWQEGMGRVAWRRRVATVLTDMTQDAVRQVALGRSLADVMVCAIDERRSGLEVVLRRELRT